MFRGLEGSFLTVQAERSLWNSQPRTTADRVMSLECQQVGEIRFLRIIPKFSLNDVPGDLAFRNKS